MYTPHVITLVNAYEDETFSVVHNVTILEGVFLDTTQAVSIGRDGSKSSDNVTLYVPFSVKATSVNGKAKRFVNGIEFQNAPGDDVWTIAPGNNSPVECFFVKGRITDVSDYATMRETHSDVYNVVSVRSLDFGSHDMRHWAVMAR